MTLITNIPIILGNVVWSEVLMLEDQQKLKLIFEWDNVLEEGKETTFFQDITDELTEECNKGEFDALDEKRAEDWNILSNQVVGRETLNSV